MDSGNVHGQPSTTKKRRRRHNTKQGLKSDSVNSVSANDAKQSIKNSKSSDTTLSKMNIKSGKVFLSPTEIRYSQSSIACRFSNGKPLGTLLDDIVYGHILSSDIPLINVARIEDQWVSADNRRLWVFKQLEILSIVETIEVKVVKTIYHKKLTSGTDGLAVTMRGNPGGYVYVLLHQSMPDLYPIKGGTLYNMDEERSTQIPKNKHEFTISTLVKEIEEKQPDSKLELVAAKIDTISPLDVDSNDVIDVDGIDEETEGDREYSNGLSYSNFEDGEFRFSDSEDSDFDYNEFEYSEEESENEDKLSDNSMLSDNIVENMSDSENQLTASAIGDVQGKFECTYVDNDKGKPYDIINTYDQNEGTPWASNFTDHFNDNGSKYIDRVNTQGQNYDTVNNQSAEQERVHVGSRRESTYFHNINVRNESNCSSVRGMSFNDISLPEHSDTNTKLLEVIDTVVDGFRSLGNFLTKLF